MAGGAMANKGQAMSDSHDQPAPSGQPEWYPPGPGTSWDPGTAAPMEPPSAPQMMEVTPTAPKSSRKRWVAMGGAAALIVAGGFAVTKIAGGGAKGGADSPELAVEGLIGSINNEDMIGAMDFVLPGERRVLKDPLIDMVSELTRLEVLSDTAKLDKVAGFDIEITLDDVQVDEVADDISVVEMSGSSKVKVDQGEIPLGDFLVENVMDGDQPTDKSTTEGEFGGDAGDPTRMATVQRDGRWYVSMFYSIAEAARTDADLEIPDAKDAIEPIGADSPEGAVENLFKAIEKTDLEMMVGILNPDEAEALQRYAPMFIDDGQDALDSFISDAGVDIQISDTEFEAKVDGDRARVVVSALTASASADGEEVTLEFADGCTTINVPDREEQKTCADDANQALDDAGLGSLTGLSGDAAITVSKVDGKWYISPIGTVMDTILNVMRKLDRKDLDKAIDSFSDLSIPGIFESDDNFDPFEEPPITDDTFDTIPDDTFDTVDPYDPYAIVSECLYGAGSDDSKACLDAALAAGQIAETDIPADVRFPECGMEEYYSKSFDATDAEFTALVTTAGACFDGHVAAGEIDEYSVPYDVMSPECWGGKNPYLLEGDALTAAFDAYYECSNA
jgi:hypothetical protein